MVGVSAALLFHAFDYDPHRTVPPLVGWLVSRPAVQRGLLVLLAMTLEEFHFRAFLQRRFGAVPASILFLLAHAGYGEPFFFVGLLAITQLLDQRSFLQVSARRKDERDRRHAGCSQRGGKRMLAITRLGHDRDNHVVATTRLAGSECEHDRLEAAHLAGSNDLKNCPPWTVVAGNVGAIYTYR